MDELHELAEAYYFGRCNASAIAKYKYNQELQFKRATNPQARQNRGERGKVCSFSDASARRFRQALRRRDVDFTHFVTITFPPELFYALGGFKRYVRYFWQTLGRELRRRHIAYIWVREPQRNGRPHYHVLCEKGHVVRLLAARINRRYLTAERAQVNLRRGIKCDVIYNQRGVEKYVGKLSNYCVKESQRVHDDGWRHWARNFKDGVAEFYTATNQAYACLRALYDKFYPFKYPHDIQIPNHVPLGTFLFSG